MLIGGIALRQLKFFFPNLMDIVCFSHTIDNVGGHFENYINNNIMKTSF